MTRRSTSRCPSPRAILTPTGSKSAFDRRKHPRDLMLRSEPPEAASWSAIRSASRLEDLTGTSEQDMYQPERAAPLLGRGHVMTQNSLNGVVRCHVVRAPAGREAISP